MKKIIGLMSLLLVVTIAMTSCRSAQPAQNGGVSQEKYRLGTYSAVFACNLRMMDKAVRETCHKACLTEIDRSNTMNACTYLYKDINGTRLHITLNELKDGRVKINMKIGAFGDKISCQSLLVELDNNLRAQGSLL